jgi:hypothetical protein
MGAFLMFQRLELADLSYNQSFLMRVDGLEQETR